MKRAQSDVHSKLARFIEQCVELSQKAVGSAPKEPLNKGNGGYADWEIVVDLREDYRHLLSRLFTGNDGVGTRKNHSSIQRHRRVGTLFQKSKVSTNHLDSIISNIGLQREGSSIIF